MLILPTPCRIPAVNRRFQRCCRWYSAARTPALTVSSRCGAGMRSAARRMKCSQMPESLAAQGVKEITLLGQIIDRYGLDLAEKPIAQQPAARNEPH